MRTAIAGVVFLVGCSSMTQPEDVLVAQEMCKERGGYSHVARYRHGKQLIINCKDETYIDVLLPEKARK